jgi:uncharacterized protein YdbL (DUF1318 family)
MRATLRLAVLLLLLGGPFAAPAFAIELKEAKAQGLVGERVDGFVGVVIASPPADVARLVERVNAQRREKYGEVASQRGVPLDAVAKIAGEKQIERAPAGQYIAGPDGRWRQK